MDKKEFLCRYHNLLERIEKKKRYIEFCGEQASSMSSPSLDGMPRSSNYITGASFERWICKKLDAENELKQMESELEIVKTEIESAISKLENEELEQVLVYHYIEWYPWSVIEKLMYLSKSSLMRLHRKALENLIIEILAQAGTGWHRLTPCGPGHKCGMI